MATQRLFINKKQQLLLKVRMKYGCNPGHYLIRAVTHPGPARQRVKERSESHALERRGNDIIKGG